MKIHVKVTKADIKNGEANSLTSCPIARALCRRHQDRYVEVGSEETARIWPRYWNSHGANWGTPHWRAILPPEALDFIQAFDSEERVEPLSFDLDFEKVQDE